MPGIFYFGGMKGKSCFWVPVLMNMLLLVACGSRHDYAVSASEAEALRAEVVGFDSDFARKKYLRHVLDLDQNVRKDLASLPGDAPEDVRQQAEQLISRTDAENLVRIEAYLGHYGYPKKSVLGVNSTECVALVIHRQDDLTVRRKYFPVIYQSYATDRLNPELMLLFLERTYHIQNGEAYEQEGPFQYQQKIDTLIELLDLQQGTVVN